MNWKNRKVLVTGAGGFIGSHLVEQLVQRGASVRAFVRYNSRGDIGHLRLLPADTIAEVELLAGDLCDPQTVGQAAAGVQTIFHLGASISIPYSYRHPAEVASANLVGTMNVLLASRDLGIERLVHASSSEVYGTALYVPIDEDHPLHGQSPYAATKIGADKLAESFYCSYDLPVVTVRPFNTYGPRQSARAVIPSIITQALGNPAISLGNPDTKRDFTFVDDTVRGFLRAAEAEGVDGKTFNLGTGQAICIGELVKKIGQILGRELSIVTDPIRMRPGKSEVLNLVSDNRKAGEQMAWVPTASLDEGLGRTIAWIQEHLDLYRIGAYEF
jgi:dTDP-glucose 4,6-dehydratase